MLQQFDRSLSALSQHREPEGHAGADADGAATAPGLMQRFKVLALEIQERQRSAEQSEQLLHTLMDAAPMAILLLEGPGTIEYANETARAVFFEGRALDGANFLSMLADAPVPFREAVLGEHDTLFTVEGDSEPEVYHLAKRNFELHGKTHTLLMVKHLTREVRRQEVEVWKRLIRVLSHELNNSLAPITSMVHSARIVLGQGEGKCADHRPRLDRVFSTIEERARHLQGFIESYARFARLPRPRRKPVSLGDLFARVGALMPFARITVTPPEATATFDPSQMEQVMINLLKNAREAGGPEDAVTVDVTATMDGGVRIAVADRGMGMSEEVLSSAMLPFYSTKEHGSGLGLPLCREIVEAHGGRIRLENREGGGLLVTCVLPGLDRRDIAAQAKLTLSRA